MYIPNDDSRNYLFCRLQLVVITFGYSTKRTNQSKFNKSPQGCWANKKEMSPPIEPINQNSIKVSKVVKPANKKMLLEHFGDLYNKQPDVHSLHALESWIE